MRGGLVMNNVSFRDYFAGLAMQGLLFADLTTNWTSEDCASFAYHQADVILAERNKEKLLSKPVAYIDIGMGGYTTISYNDEDIDNFAQGTPLYTSPPKREPLSDGEICEILLKKEWKGFVELVRQIEKAHGIGVE